MTILDIYIFYLCQDDIYMYTYGGGDTENNMWVKNTFKQEYPLHPRMKLCIVDGFRSPHRWLFFSFQCAFHCHLIILLRFSKVCWFIPNSTDSWVSISGWCVVFHPFLPEPEACADVNDKWWRSASQNSYGASLQRDFTLGNKYHG